MKSYYQYYPPISIYENEIRDLFLKGLDEYRNEYLKEKNTYEESAFIHIRRNDYIKLSNYHYVQDMDYYNKALLLLEKNENIKKFYIFSDDISYIKKNFTKDNFIIIDEKNELKSLALMSLCTGGAICANSTFSWWGAFLGAYGKNNTVIVPSKWINEKIYNLFPEEWIII
jgi:hypothetical protein